MGDDRGGVRFLARSTSRQDRLRPNLRGAAAEMALGPEDGILVSPRFGLVRDWRITRRDEEAPPHPFDLKSRACAPMKKHVEQRRDLAPRPGGA